MVSILFIFIKLFIELLTQTYNQRRVIQRWIMMPNGSFGSLETIHQDLHKQLIRPYVYWQTLF